MAIKFRGGERIQRGKGIGGILRAVAGFFKPILRSAGSTLVKAVKSDTGRAIGNVLKDQAINSGVNLTVEALRGNDLKESIANEVGAARGNFANEIENANNIRKARKRAAVAPKINKRKKKKVGEITNAPTQGYKTYIKKTSKYDPL